MQIINVAVTSELSVDAINQCSRDLGDMGAKMKKKKKKNCQMSVVLVPVWIYAVVLICQIEKIQRTVAIGYRH